MKKVLTGVDRITPTVNWWSNPISIEPLFDGKLAITAFGQHSNRITIDIGSENIDGIDTVELYSNTTGKKVVFKRCEE